MTRKFHPILCAALAVCTAAATLYAQTPNAPATSGDAPAGGPPPGHHGPPSPLFRALDTNGDGVISADEIANAPAALKTLAGASGQITRESVRPPRRDHDGPGPRDDSPRPHHPRPDAQGDDNNGGPAPRPPRPDGDHGPGKPGNSPDASPATGGAPADGPAHHHHGPPPHGDGLFDALDTNGDGVISADEIAAAATALKKADTNGDGVIDRRDFRPPPPPPASAD